MILAIDPGSEESAFALMDGTKLIASNIYDNNNLLVYLKALREGNHMAIEMIASYGMPVGRSVFETCVWIGRFIEAWNGMDYSYVYRQDVKRHLCNGSMKAKDSNIRQAIMDKYGSTREIAIGKKKTPGPLYGVSKDMWAAIGVGLTYQKL
jgi:hypothetical protein